MYFRCHQILKQILSDFIVGVQHFIVKYRSLSFLCHNFSLKNISGNQILFESVLNENILEVIWNFSPINDHVEIKWVIQKILWLKLLFLVHLGTKIFRSCLIGWYHVHVKLSTLAIFANYGQSVWIIEHVSKSLRCKESPSN